MEYAICRAKEVKRLSYENHIGLKVYERNANRCLMPWEIQERFNLPPLKLTYMIPEIEATQASHNARIKSRLYELGIFPKYLYLSALDPETAQRFDEVIDKADIDFVYSGGSKKGKFRDQLEEI